MAWDPNKKVYTRSGDGLSTSLPNVRRVSKADERIQLLGSLDELNSHLGLARVLTGGDTAAFIRENQKKLMMLMGAIAEGFVHGPALTLEDIRALERGIDGLDAHFARESRFYVPGDSLAGAYLDIARTVARRAERAMAACSRFMDFPPEASGFVNRLSDYLYVLARYMDSLAG